MRCTVFVSGFVSVFVYGFVYVFVYGFVSYLSMDLYLYLYFYLCLYLCMDLYLYLCMNLYLNYTGHLVSAPEEYLHPAIFAAFGSSALTSWIYLILPNDISKVKVIDFLYLLSV